MSLETQAIELAIAVGQDVKALKDSFGNLDDLQTNSKTLDGAINELQTALDNLTGSTTIIEP